MVRFVRPSVAALLVAAFGANAVTLADQTPQTDAVVAERPLSSMVAMTAPGDIAEIVRGKVAEIAAGGSTAGFPLRSAVTDTVRITRPFSAEVIVSWLDRIEGAGPAATARRFGANCDAVAFFGDGWNAGNGASDAAGPISYESARMLARLAEAFGFTVQEFAPAAAAVLDGITLPTEVISGSAAFGGSSGSGWIWSNHEYISNGQPTPTSAPSGQHLQFARFLKQLGILTNDVESDVWTQDDIDTYIRQYKKQLGGSWMRIFRDPANGGRWTLDLTASNERYDSTSNTLASVVGYDLRNIAKADDGTDLPPNVAPGIAGDCSLGQTPWGTIITAEENVQSYYGDLETSWNSNNRFLTGRGFDPGSFIELDVAPTEFSSYGLISNPAERKDKDNYGFLVEIDPGVDPSTYYVSVNEGGDGSGHRKLGVMGRVRWENCTFAMGDDFKLLPNQPVVIYGANDRRSGRIYKWVSEANYVPGMTKGEVRALLDTGTLYVAHFEDLEVSTGLTLASTGEAPTEETRGTGRWIEISLDSTDTPPNAAALGAPDTTVGQALQDVNWNGIGGYASQNDLMATLFTAGNKLGVSETNRPEDLEYNPLGGPVAGLPARIFVAFTNHTRPTACNQDGVLDPTTVSRQDADGAIFVLEEVANDTPASSGTFTYWQAFKGGVPGAGEDGLFVAGDPDNLAIDKQGGVWFGTDGHFGSTGGTRSDAIYYLDLDPSRKAGEEGVVFPTFGMAFRVIGSPSDSEATGPWFTPDQSTLFFNVQHPGENFASTPSTWPPLSAK
jgi:secreted PhoX family phosphatase